MARGTLWFIQHWYSNDEWFQMLWGRLIPSFYPKNNILHPQWSTLWSCSVGKASWGFRSGQYLSSSQSIIASTDWLFTNQIVPGMRQRRQRKRRRSAGNSHLQFYSGESSLGSQTQIFVTGKRSQYIPDSFQWRQRFGIKTNKHAISIPRKPKMCNFIEYKDLQVG